MQSEEIQVERADVVMPGSDDSGKGAVVDARGLTKTFMRDSGEAVHAMRGISLTVLPGEFLVLLGPSGCGKTTLLRSIAGLEVPDAGELWIHGRQVLGAGRHVPPDRRSLSMIFQSYALWPHMTGFGNVAYPLLAMRPRPNKAKVQELVNEVLRLLSIEELSSSYPGQMSGGQQQRVALARALVAENGLILFDEPLSNVDAKIRDELRVELAAMQERIGFAAIYVTHDQQEALSLADRIAVVGDGGVLQLGSPADVYYRPSTRYVANFVGRTSDVVGTIDRHSATTASVHAGSMQIRGTLATEVAAGEVAAVWRPENSHETSEDAVGSNVFHGLVKAVTFLGAQSEYVVDVDGHDIKHVEYGAPKRHVGDKLSLRVAEEDVRIVPSDM